jgi:plastocyanin
VNGTAILVLGLFSETAFYVVGCCLAALAIVVTAIGLRSSGAFSTSLLARLGILAFVVLSVGTAVFAIAFSRDEQAHRRAELAKEEAEVGAKPASAGGEAPANAGAESTPAKKAQPAAKGPGGTVKLAADPTQIAYDTKSLSSKPGEVTIDFDNPSQISHDVAIAKGGQEIAKSKLVAQGSTSVSADLAPGKYVFYCTVPGHREAGMQGTLTVR